MNDNHNPNRDHRRDPDRDRGNDNVPEGRAVAPALAQGAVVSLAALATTLNKIDTASVGGRSGKPLLQFRSRENGTWTFGQRRTVVEEGSRWAVNPTMFQWGYICFQPGGGKVLGERLVPAHQPKPNVAELPDTGAPWQEEWGADVKCTSGVDQGTEATFKATTDGTTKAIVGLIDAVRERLNGGQHDGKIVPVVALGRDSYPHPEYGKTWIPVLSIVDWVSFDGPTSKPAAPTPKPAAPRPDLQPRRRRVG